MLFHEAGHAYMAKKYNCEVDYIELFAIFGRCHYRETETLYESYVIAWGGVLAQFILFIPAFIYVTVFELTKYNYLNIFLSMFGYFNLMMIAFNLVPIPGLDGERAWKVIPIWFKSIRLKKYTKKEPVIKKIKPTKNYLKVIK